MTTPQIPSLDDIPVAVREELALFLDSQRDAIASIGSPVTNAISYLESFVLDGGKRIRPLYAWAGFIGAHGLEGTESPQAMLRAASSLEFIQA